LRPRPSIVARFLYYQLLSPGFINYIDGLTYGTKMPRTSAEQVGDTLVTVPSLAEQQAITAFLDYETGRIDSLVAMKKRLVELLQEKRAALISRAVTKGLDPSAPMKDSGVPWVGEIPAYWDVIPLKRVVRIRYGLGQPPAESAEGLPLLRATNVDSGKIVVKDLMHVDPDDVPQGRGANLVPGEIIVVRSGAYTGDSAIIPPRFQGAIAGYDLVATVTNAVDDFIAWQLLASHVRDIQIRFESLRAAQPHLNAEQLAGILVSLPPKSEQREIASYLGWETAKLDVLEIKVRAVISQLVEYRAALISAAVTGKIDLREAQ